MVEPDRQRPLCILRGARRGRWRWTSEFDPDDLSMICLLIPYIYVFSPEKVIFAGAGVLLLAATEVVASQEALVDIFERIENFFRRLETYTEVPTAKAMRDIIVRIMVEVLGIFAVVTKEMKQGRAKKYLKKLVGRTDIEDALTRLDKLTQEKARMAIAQILKVAYRVED
ncbi:hypothetical protein EDB87DRAFT_754228 [Lactarius vividus]|nr:hypothetical protein EDB87DRAFT_754228 [Lactarius vividus]